MSAIRFLDTNVLLYAYDLDCDGFVFEVTISLVFMRATILRWSSVIVATLGGTWIFLLTALILILHF